MTISGSQKGFRGKLFNNSVKKKKKKIIDPEI